MTFMPPSPWKSPDFGERGNEAFPLREGIEAAPLLSRVERSRSNLLRCTGR